MHRSSGLSLALALVVCLLGCEATKGAAASAFNNGAAQAAGGNGGGSKGPSANGSSQGAVSAAAGAANGGGGAGRGAGAAGNTPGEPAAGGTPGGSRATSRRTDFTPTDGVGPRIEFLGQSPQFRLYPSSEAAVDAAANATSAEYVKLRFGKLQEVDANGRPVRGLKIPSLAAVKGAEYEAGVFEFQGVNMTYVLILFNSSVLGNSFRPCPNDTQFNTLPMQFGLRFMFGNAEDVTFPYGDGNNITMPANSTKFNIEASNWPFCDGADRLQLTLEVVTVTADGGAGGDGNVTEPFVDASGATVVRMPLGGNSSTLLSFPNVAYDGQNGTTQIGVTTEVDVSGGAGNEEDVEQDAEEEEEEEEAGVAQRMRLTLTIDSFINLYYDPLVVLPPPQPLAAVPSTGSGPNSSSGIASPAPPSTIPSSSTGSAAAAAAVPAAIVVAAVVAVAVSVAAVIVRRRHRAAEGAAEPLKVAPTTNHGAHYNTLWRPDAAAVAAVVGKAASKTSPWV